MDPRGYLVDPDPGQGRDLKGTPYLKGLWIQILILVWVRDCSARDGGNYVELGTHLKSPITPKTCYSGPCTRKTLKIPKPP